MTPSDGGYASSHLCEEAKCEETSPRFFSPSTLVAAPLRTAADIFNKHKHTTKCTHAHERVHLNVLILYSCTRSHIQKYLRDNAFVRAFLIVHELLTRGVAGIMCAHLV